MHQHSSLMLKTQWAQTLNVTNRRKEIWTKTNWKTLIYTCINKNYKSLLQSMKQAGSKNKTNIMKSVTLPKFMALIEAFLWDCSTHAGCSLKRNKHMCFIDAGNCLDCMKREIIADKIQIIKKHHPHILLLLHPWVPLSC